MLSFNRSTAGAWLRVTDGGGPWIRDYTDALVSTKFHLWRHAHLLRSAFLLL